MSETAKHVSITLTFKTDTEPGLVFAQLMESIGDRSTFVVDGRVRVFELPEDQPFPDPEVTIEQLRTELAEKHAELRTEIECNYPDLREYAFMNADLQDQGFEPGEAGLRTALGRLLRIREAIQTADPADDTDWQRGFRALADRIGHILGQPNSWACSGCYGFGNVLDWSNWSPGCGEPRRTPCPACASDQPEQQGEDR